MDKNNNNNNAEKNENIHFKLPGGMTEEQFIERIFGVSEEEKKNRYKIDSGLSFSETRTKTIGENIRYYRALKDLSQERLGTMLKVDRTTISNWESGNSCPDGWQMEDLARLFEIDINELHTKKVYSLRRGGNNHPKEEELEEKWLQAHPDDLLNKDLKAGLLEIWEGDLQRDYVRIERVDLLVIALELIERGFLVGDCFLDYADGNPYKRLEIFLKKSEINRFKTEISRILINFATNTSQFQSVLELRRAIFDNDGDTSYEAIEGYIKNNRTLSKYHRAITVDDSNPENDGKLIAFGTDIEKTYDAIKNVKPKGFEIIGFSEQYWEYKYSYHIDDVDWNKIADKE